MLAEILGDFVCPACKMGKFESKNGTQEEKHAKLECSNCHRTYPIINSIPRFVPSNNYATTFGFQWNLHAKTQIDSFNGYRLSHDRFFNVTRWPREMKGEYILEAGCGAGRFTEVILETGAFCYSFDYSDSVEANFMNNGYHGRSRIFQADIHNIPLKQEMFDRILCFGVLQHTPDPEKAFLSLIPFLKPGGYIAIDIYQRHLVTYINPKYFLRFLTKRVDKIGLYKRIERWIPTLLPIQDGIASMVGRKMSCALIPISPSKHNGIREEDRTLWSTLDTFDMYAPAHDHPQSINAVRKWFEKAGLIDFWVGTGPNGVNGRGRKPINEG